MQDALKTILLLDAHGQFSLMHDRSHLVMGNANVLDDYAESEILPIRPGVMATGSSDSSMSCQRRTIPVWRSSHAE